MMRSLAEDFPNPSSPHREGERVNRILQSAREQVAELIGAELREIVFTSGATEANNLALLGVGRANESDRVRVLVSPIEHKSVLEAADQLRSETLQMEFLRVGCDGAVDLDALQDQLDDSVLLVSVQAASNEIGTAQLVDRIGQLAHQVGALFHCDAAQAIGRRSVDVDTWGVDLLSLSGHKFYGPKGTGALFVRGGPANSTIGPIVFGGGQEEGLRPGTPNVPAIVGMGRASELVQQLFENEDKRIRDLRDRFESRVLGSVEGARVNGALSHRLSGSSSITFPAVDAEALIANLPEVAISGGSACTSGSIEPSHVLRAIGMSDEDTLCTVRVGLGRFTTADEIDEAASRVVAAVRRIRELELS